MNDMTALDLPMLADGALSPTNLTVIDSIMGSGKTTWMINAMREIQVSDIGRSFMSERQPRNFLYIAPTLDEVERIQSALPDLNLRDPEPVGGRKINHLNQLIAEGANIVSTHALFQMLTRETYELLREGDYILVIDEVLHCVKTQNLTADDRRLLRGTSEPMTIVDERGRLRWNYADWPKYAGKFDEIKGLCDNGNLVVCRDSIILREFPAEFLGCFSEAYILTYLFEGSPMSSYLKANGVPYTCFGIHQDELTPVEEIDDSARRSRLRELISIVEDPKLNAIGSPRSRENPLSASWFVRRKKTDHHHDLRRLRLNTEEFFRRYAETPSNANLWTTFKKVKSDLSGKGYARGFVPVNCKATNAYIEKRSVAYLVNVFHRPDIAGYFEDQGTQIDQNLHALSEMLQLIWRTQIRRGDPITVYIPSERMRGLMKLWLIGGAAAVRSIPICEERAVETSQMVKEDVV